LSWIRDRGFPLPRRTMRSSAPVRRRRRAPFREIDVEAPSPFGLEQTALIGEALLAVELSLFFNPTDSLRPRPPRKSDSISSAAGFFFSLLSRKRRHLVALLRFGAELGPRLVTWTVQPFYSRRTSPPSEDIPRHGWFFGRKGEERLPSDEIRYVEPSCDGRKVLVRLLHARPRFRGFHI